MNSTDLYEYGIADEQSDLRIHVCVKARRLYVYQTEVVRELLTVRDYPLRSASQNGQLTAYGYVIPWRDIPNIKEEEVAADIWKVIPIGRDMDPTEKGRRAAEIARAFLQTGTLRFAPLVEVVHDFDRQLAGADLVVSIRRIVQVKCDYNGGNKAYGGTGNLFIQTAERNPHQRH